MSKKDKQAVSGALDITITRGDGTVEKHHVENLVTDLGRAHFAKLLVGAAGGLAPVLPNPLLCIAVGDGTTAPTVADTTLESELKRYEFGPTAPGAVADEAHFMAVVPPGAFVSAQSISEAGLFNAFTDNDTPDEGVMTNRALIGPYVLNPTDALAIVWTVTFTP